jgi:sensor domain CHASE-containing protein
MREKLGGRAKEALTELEEKPDSQLNQDDLRTQLAKLLEKQPDLVPELRTLLSAAQMQTHSQIQNVGERAQGVQIEGNQNRASISVRNS